MRKVIIERDPTHENILWIQTPGDNITWDDHHVAWNDLADYATRAESPFYVIFQPTHDIPKGSPLSHMKRLVDIAKSQPNILELVIVLDRSMPLAKMFVRVLAGVFSFGKSVKIVNTLNDAMAVIQDDVSAE